MDDRCASAALRCPINCPTRIDAAIPIANGKLKKRNAAKFRAITCASKATVDISPDKIVVISKLHASNVILSAPDKASLRNGFMAVYCRFSRFTLGHVSFNLFFRSSMYAPISKNSAALVNVVAHDAPCNPIPALNISPQLNNAFRPLAIIPIITLGARLFCV